MPNYTDFDLDIQNKSLRSYGQGEKLARATRNTCYQSCGCRTHENTSCPDKTGCLMPAE